MPIISGEDSDFGRLVVEEFERRARRIVDLGQASSESETVEMADDALDEDPVQDHSPVGPSRFRASLRRLHDDELHAIWL
jgi:hypothetical protein